VKVLSTKSARPSLRTLLTISAIAILTAGCGILGSGVKEIQTVAEPTERTPLNIDPARPVDLDGVEWIVVTEDNADEVLGQLDNPVVFGLSTSDYERLSINFAEIRQHINTQRNILMRYKEYYEEDTNPPAPSE